MAVIDLIIVGFVSISLVVSLSRTPTVTKISTEELTDIEISAKALEIYLQDKQDHDKYCPFFTWEQPSLEVYKKTLESQLPEGCKK